MFVNVETGETVEALPEGADPAAWLSEAELGLEGEAPTLQTERADLLDWLAREETRDAAEAEALGRQVERRIRRLEARRAWRQFHYGSLAAHYVRELVGDGKRRSVDLAAGRWQVRTSQRAEVVDEAAALAAAPAAAVKIVPETRKLLTSALERGTPHPGVRWVTVERVALDGGPTIAEREVAAVEPPAPAAVVAEAPAPDPEPEASPPPAAEEPTCRRHVYDAERRCVKCGAAAQRARRGARKGAAAPEEPAPTPPGETAPLWAGVAAASEPRLLDRLRGDDEPDEGVW